MRTLFEMRLCWRGFMAVMVRLSPQIWLPLSCSRATAAVSALPKRTMATRLSCRNSAVVSLLWQQRN